MNQLVLPSARSRLCPSIHRWLDSFQERTPRRGSRSNKAEVSASMFLATIRPMNAGPSQNQLRDRALMASHGTLSQRGRRSSTVHLRGSTAPSTRCTRWVTTCSYSAMSLRSLEVPATHFCFLKAVWELLQRPDTAPYRGFIVADVAVVMLFVLIGRNEHNSGSQFVDYLSTVGPFLMAIAVAWCSPQVRRSPASARSGLIVWGSVIILGLMFRRIIFGDGTAFPFVVVATIFNGVFLQSWRFLARSRQRRPDRGVPIG